MHVILFFNLVGGVCTTLSCNLSPLNSVYKNLVNSTWTIALLYMYCAVEYPAVLVYVSLNYICTCSYITIIQANLPQLVTIPVNLPKTATRKHLEEAVVSD